MKYMIEQVWNVHEKELRNFIRKRVTHSPDADDLLHEVFLKITKHRDKVIHAQNPGTYIFAIARNVINDFFRQQKTKEASIKEMPPFEDSDECNFTQFLAQCCLPGFIRKLPEKYREALILSEIQQVPQKEIAQKLGISYSGAKSRIQRGRQKLKAIILDCCPYESDVYGNLLEPINSSCSA